MNTPWTPDEYTRAYLFAARAHQGKTWPGNLELSYMVHVDLVCMEVTAALLVEPEHDGDLAVKCALLHDVIEDTQVGNEEIKSSFGIKVADGGQALSKNTGLDKS
jgi:(p)ppGpp synthase/HD superfamily hydrolase